MSRGRRTDADRDARVVRIVGALERSGVPPHLRDGVLRYLADGILPGGFLQAVLCNDLREAVTWAAPGAVAALPALVEFLTIHAPATAWGSRVAVLLWTTTPDRLEI